MVVRSANSRTLLSFLTCCCLSLRGSSCLLFSILAGESCVVWWSKRTLTIFPAHFHNLLQRVSIPLCFAPHPHGPSISQGNLLQAFSGDAWDFHKELGQKCMSFIPYNKMCALIHLYQTAGWFGLMPSSVYGAAHCINRIHH